MTNLKVVPINPTHAMMEMAFAVYRGKKNWEDTLRSAILAAPGVAVASVPSGYKLVPIEPTEEMLRRVFTTSLGNVTRRHKAHDVKTRAVWAAMLSAAPQVPNG